MSDFARGPGWWQASDGRWYEPELHPNYRPPAPPLPPHPQAGPQYAVPGQPYQYQPAPLPYVQPGYPAPSSTCPTCATAVVATAAVCPRCGTRVGTPKDKTVAVLLAVFLAPWNWLYTYQRDAAKFWVGLALFVVGLILAVVFVGFVLIAGVWIWAIVDTATKPDSYYRQFPNGPG